MRDKIHIAVLIRYPVGGIRTYLKYTYGKFSKNKYSFTIVGPSSVWMDRIQNDLSGHDIEVVVSERGEELRSLLYTVLRVFYRKRPDIIHSQGYTAGILGILANATINAPHIITLHRIFGHDQFSDDFWGKMKTVKKKLIECFLKRADVVQSVSNDAQSNLLEYFPGLSKISHKLKVIPNGISIEAFDEALTSDITTFPRMAGKFYIGYFGRYMPEKGFPHLIEVMDILVKQKKINHVQVVSVGGFGAFIREYQKEIKRRSLEDYFLFLDFFENIGPVLRDIELLVIPSLSEACPLVPMEGLVCGKPTLAYACPGLREVLNDTPSQMVATGDYSALIDQILVIMHDYSRIKTHFESFAPQARKRFDAAQTAGQLDQLFEDILNNKLHFKSQ